MATGALTSHLDVAQVTLYAFWVFFAGLIYYLHRENKREGYPLESDRSERAPRVKIQGFPPIPEPKFFDAPDGRRIASPNFKRETRELALRPAAPHPGAAFEPTGDPMRASPWIVRSGMSARSA
jgi:photosynthetic reaction center H subunit